MGNGWTILDDQHSLAYDSFWMIQMGDRGCLQNFRLRIHQRNILSNLFQGLLTSFIHLCNDEKISPPQVHLSGIVELFVARPQGIYENNLPIRPDKRKIIVASIPDNHLRLLFGHPQYLFVIHTGVDGNSHLNERLEFLSLFDGARLLLHIVHAGKTEHRSKLAISHRMTDDRYLKTSFS